MIQNSSAGESRVVKIFGDEFRTPADCSRRCLSGRGHSVNVFFFWPPVSTWDLDVYMMIALEPHCGQLNAY